VAMGWGRTETGNIVEILQKGNLIIQKDKSCFESSGSKKAPWEKWSSYQNSYFCLGGVLDGEWSPSTGQGDSGGPIVCRDSLGNPVHCGIVSFGPSASAKAMKKCVEKADEASCKPGVMTEVDYFVDWIKSIAGEQDPATLHKPYLYGEVVKGNEGNHQVRITSDGGKPCGGTLVEPDLIVTAAQCVTNGDGSGKELAGLKVLSGLRDISKEQGQPMEIKAVVSHPGLKKISAPLTLYNGQHVFRADYRYENDVAVIRLKSPVNGASNLPKLPVKGENAENPAVEYAFPRDTTRGGEMRRREFTILTKEECQRRMNLLEVYNMSEKVDEKVLCGVEKYSGGSICDRELGGGLLCKAKDGSNTLCGVQVYRLCDTSLPNNFANLEKHADWINEVKQQL